MVQKSKGLGSISYLEGMTQNQVQHQNAAAGPNVVVVTPVAVALGGRASQFLTTSLYMGDLDFTVTDSQLYDLFNQVGQVVFVRVCRGLNTRRSLGYGYVNYSSPQNAAMAMEVLNFTPLNNKSIRIKGSASVQWLWGWVGLTVFLCSDLVGGGGDVVMYSWCCGSRCDDGGGL
ncbi:unnamed protein product [Fraxinus pennsylvanica]|uniref:RRM domain-containing protein n=1 Tax=Fraxinus pennsylvanica TaxID=56036 RepID=A0AAD1ZZV3_9LAMI|nr:unnamed protein product [Fraxinus pennsylvanica]